MILNNNFRFDSRVLREARSLVKAGYDVTVYAIKDPALPTMEYRDGIRIIRASEWLHWAPRTRRAFKAYFEMYNEIKKEAYDFYHCHDFDTLLLGLFLSRRGKAKWIYDAHEYFKDWAGFNRPIKGIFLIRFFWNTLEKFCSHRADAIITVSYAIAQKFQDEWRTNNIVVIQNCTNIKETKNENLLRKEFSISNNERVILYQGDINANRGIETLIDAMLKVENAKLIIMGNGLSKSEMLTLINEKELSNKIFIKNAVPYDDILRFTASADIGICTVPFNNKSFYMSAPNKLFEYLMAGLPVIASNFPEMARIINSSQAGLLVDPMSPDAIADGINYLIKNDLIYKKMKSNAKKAAKELYNWEIEEKKLLELYQMLQN